MPKTSNYRQPTWSQAGLAAFTMAFASSLLMTPADAQVRRTIKTSSYKTTVQLVRRKLEEHAKLHDRNYRRNPGYAVSSREGCRVRHRSIRAWKNGFLGTQILSCRRLSSADSP